MADGFTSHLADCDVSDPPFFHGIRSGLHESKTGFTESNRIVGIRNFERMLGLNVLLVQPERNDQGSLILDQQGQPTYPRLRKFTLNNLEYPISTASVNG